MKGWATVSKGETALKAACANNQPASVRLLLQYGANANDQNPLAACARSGAVDGVKALIQQGVNADNKFAALIEASRAGHLPICQLLVQNGVAVNPQTEQTEQNAGVSVSSTPLAEAVNAKHIDVVKWLLANGAKPKIGYNPLGYAATNNDVEMTALLLEHGADPNQRLMKAVALPYSGCTPLYVAHANAQRRCEAAFIEARS